MTVTVDPPTKLPVSHLSVSSLNLLAKCPLSWRHKYIDRIYEPPSGPMILGSAAGAAETDHFQAVVDGEEGHTTEEVLDLFSGEWDHRLEKDDVQFGDTKPGLLKDAGAAALAAYHKTIAPTVEPVSTERQFTIEYGLDWKFTGYLDIETVDGGVRDLKMKGRSMSQAEADGDVQPSSYLYARRVEGNPATGFTFDTMIHGNKTPIAKTVETNRTDVQLDAFEDRLFEAAAEIAWRAENDHWSPAPPNVWWCSQKMCGHWAGCPHGGLR